VVSWNLDLLVSDGRYAPSRSHVCSSEPRHSLTDLVYDLFPLFRPASLPVWIRLDIAPSSGCDPEVVETIRGAFGREVLRPLGLSPELPVTVVATTARTRLWVDRVSPVPPAFNAVHSALTETQACLLRHLDPGEGTALARVCLLASLLLLQRVISDPSVELACMGLTRSMLGELQPASSLPGAPRVVHVGGRPQVLASALLLAALAEQERSLSIELAPVARDELSCWLLGSLPRLTPSLHGPVFFALAGLAPPDLGSSSWDDHLLTMVRTLAGQSIGGEASRCWCLAALLRMSEHRRSPHTVGALDLTPRDVISLACLPQIEGNLGVGAALRTVLLSRLLPLMVTETSEAPTAEQLKSAGQVLLERQCDPQRAMEGPTPQSVLGAFVSPACRTFSPWAQLAPLLALTELHRLQDGVTGRALVGGTHAAI
jgi:hypothetical protein